ncbi:MAG: YeeE/YedE thiosulfate transporter family protein [Candidatus Rifleibacteriota bacterium]
MIESFYQAELLNSLPALITAFVIGLGSGWCVQQAGLSSSKRLTSLFYFKDMVLVKVGLTAIITAMTGLLFLNFIGLVKMDAINIASTLWGAQLIGGLIFGLGFVIGGWSPGFATVGAVSGRIDAIVFLIGIIIGSFAFSEAYPWINSNFSWGPDKVNLLFNHFDLNIAEMGLFIAFVGILILWLVEVIESGFEFSEVAQRGKSLWIFSIAVLIVASGNNLVFSGAKVPAPSHNLTKILRENVKNQKIISPLKLARLIVEGQKKIACVDVRSQKLFDQWHIAGATNLAPEDSLLKLRRYKKFEQVILYGNDMIRPAQVQLALQSEGYNNCHLMYGGVEEFFNQVLKPAALRNTDLSGAQINEIEKFHGIFLGSMSAVSSANRPTFNSNTSGSLNK